MPADSDRFRESKTIPPQCWLPWLFPGLPTALKFRHFSFSDGLMKKTDNMLLTPAR
jgi:hypothetical protein